MPLPHTPIHSNLAGDSWKNTRSHTEERKLFWTDRRTTKRKGVLPLEHVNCNCKCKVLKQFKLSQDAAGNFRRGGEHFSVCLGKDPLRHCSQLYKLYIDWPCCFTSTANIKYRQGAKVLCCTGRRQGGNGGGGGGGGGMNSLYSLCSSVCMLQRVRLGCHSNLLRKTILLYSV